MSAARAQILHAFRARLKASTRTPNQLAALRTPFRDVLSHAAVYLFDERCPNLSARSRLSPGQRRLFIALAGMLTCALIAAPVMVLIGLNTLFLVFCLSVFLLRLVLLYLSIGREAEHRAAPRAVADDELPMVTILCPMYREERGLPHLVDALLGLDYPNTKLDIKLLLEEDDAATIACARLLCQRTPFDIVIVPDSLPRTKPKACNYGLWSALGDLLVIYDAEDRPERDQLRIAAATFAAGPPELACVQARLNYYNREKTWITRLFAIEYALLFDLVLPGLAKLRAPLPLGGTSNVFKTDHLIAVGGWDPFNVTEDADLGMRLAAAGLTSQTIDSTTYEEATSRLAPWLRQRSRWIKGYLQTWMVHVRAQGPSRLWTTFLSLHLLIGSVVVAALFNPIFWLLYGLWLSGAADWAEPLFPTPLDAFAAAALLAGNFFHLWLFMLAPMRRRWLDLVPYALLAPIYWLMQSVAGYIALWQFITKPFYWEKTTHSAGESAEAVLAKVGGEAAA